MYHLLFRTGRLSVVEITTVTITQSEKRQSREWYVYHFKRRVLKSIFQINGKYFYGAKKQMNIGSRMVRVPLLVIEETKGYLK